MKDILDNPFTSVLRITSGQVCEPEFVLVEHSYALPWSFEAKSALSQHRKTLFLGKTPLVHIHESRDEVVDVESVSPATVTIPYDVKKGQHLMKECERHVAFADVYNKDLSINDCQNNEGNWEERVNKTGWTELQNDLFLQIVKILDADRLSKLSLQEHPNEPVKRRAMIDKTAGKFCQVFSSLGWDMKAAQWLHNTLIQNMTASYISIYLDILQTLKSKIPTLIDKVISSSFSQRGHNQEALNLLLKRPWDPVSPVLSQFKPNRVENEPVILQVPSGSTLPDIPVNSRRLRFFNSQLQHISKHITLPVSFDMKEASFDTIMNELRSKVAEYKMQYFGRPVALLGWGFGALLACQLSLVEKVSANICLGFPMLSHDWKRGESHELLLEMCTPSLFIVGQKATDVNIDDIEDFRQHLNAPSSLVVIAGGNSAMKVSTDKCYWDGITQSMVDRCIVDEIGEFLSYLLSDRKKTCDMAESSDFMNPLPPKVNRRESGFPRKRKLSPSHPSSKILQTGDSRTAISQNLGLKIPIGLPMAHPHRNAGQETFSSVKLASGERSCSSLTDAPVSLVDSTLTHPQMIQKDLPSNYKICPDDGDDSECSITKPCCAVKPAIGSNLSSFALCSSSCSSTPVATIALGSLASVSKQKYQRMFQISDLAQALDIKSKVPTIDSHGDGKVDIVGITSVTKSLTADSNSSSNDSQHTPKNIGQKGRRGSAPKRELMPNKTKECDAEVPILLDDLTSNEEREINGNSMAVLTLTGSPEGGSGVEAAGRGISSLGRGVLTLGKGEKSTVRVYSTSSQVSSSPTSGIFLNLHGISASRSSRISNTVDTTKASFELNPSDPTATAVSSGGVEITKNIHGIPTFKTDWETPFDTFRGKDTTIVSLDESGVTELDLLAATAAELYEKEKIDATMQKLSCNDVTVPVIPATSRQNINFITAKADDGSSLLPHQSVWLRDKTDSMIKIPFSSTGIRLINSQIGKIATKSVTISNNAGHKRRVSDEGMTGVDERKKILSSKKNA